MSHNFAHPLAGDTCRARPRNLGNRELREYQLEDWWDRAYGLPWRESLDVPIVRKYHDRARSSGLPLDNDVVVGALSGERVVLHASEVEPIPAGVNVTLPVSAAFTVMASAVRYALGRQSYLPTEICQIIGAHAAAFTYAERHTIARDVRGHLRLADDDPYAREWRGLIEALETEPAATT